MTENKQVCVLSLCCVRCTSSTMLNRLEVQNTHCQWVNNPPLPVLLGREWPDCSLGWPYCLPVPAQQALHACTSQRWFEPDFSAISVAQTRSPWLLPGYSQPSSVRKAVPDLELAHCSLQAHAIFSCLSQTDCGLCVH